MEILTIKIWGGVLLFLCMVVFGLLPIFHSQFKTNSRMLSYCNCFCGGLFLAIGLVHILPEAHEMLDESPAKSRVLQEDASLKCGDDGLQWSYLICLMSFSAILMLDKVIFNNADIAEGNEHLESPSNDNLRKSVLNSSIKETMLENSDKIQDNFKERVSSKFKIALRLSRSSSLKSVDGNPEDFTQHDELLEKPKPKVIKTGDTKGGNDDKSSEILQEPLLSDSENVGDHSNRRNKTGDQNWESKGQMLLPVDESQVSEQKEFEVDTVDEENQQKGHSHSHSHGEGHAHHNLVGKDDSILTSIILLVAMGIHGFFALLAFGIEPSKSGTINLFIALIVHKWSEALTVGKHPYGFKYTSTLFDEKSHIMGLFEVSTFYSLALFFSFIFLILVLITF